MSPRLRRARRLESAEGRDREGSCTGQHDGDSMEVNMVGPSSPQRLISPKYRNVRGLQGASPELCTTFPQTRVTLTTSFEPIAGTNRVS